MAQNRKYNDQYMLRLPDGMRERIRRKAKANKRSMQIEILDLLEANFPDESIDKQIFDLEIQLEQLRKQKAERASQ